MKTVHIGGRLRDAANPADGVRPDQCAVCGSTDRNTLHTTNLDHADLARIGLRGATPHMCLPHYQAAMERLGAPSPIGNQARCTRCHSFAVSAVWPLTSFVDHTIRGCRGCLLDAVRALATEGTHP